jgi:hypothetical protein
MKDRVYRSGCCGREYERETEELDKRAEFIPRPVAMVRRSRDDLGQQPAAGDVEETEDTERKKDNFLM